MSRPITLSLQSALLLMMMLLAPALAHAVPPELQIIES